MWCGVLFIKANNVKSRLVEFNVWLKCKKTLITKKCVNKSLCNDVNLHSAELMFWVFLCCLRKEINSVYRLNVQQV